MTSDSLRPRRVLTSRRLVLGCGVAFVVSPRDLLAAPKGSQTLFVIARSKNANVLHYDVRFRDDVLDLDEPMTAYWVMHAEDRRREGLTWLERELAYGFRIASRVTNDGFRVVLKAFPRRQLAVRRHLDGGYRAYVRIDGHGATLDRIFVSAYENGATPTVRFIELSGTAQPSGKRVFERIVP